MKNKENGFTLAEILITLGIISVIAAITLPSMTINVRHKTYEATAQRVAVLLESGMVETIHRAQSSDEETGAVQTLAAIQVKDVIGGNTQTYITSGTTLFDSLGSIIGVDAVSAAEQTAYIGSAKNANNTAVNWNDYHVYKMRNLKSYVTVKPIPAANEQGDDGAILTDIYIDANGEDAPNRMYHQTTFPNGDIFKYQLLNNGHIVRVQ